MAINASRSMNASLVRGATDGKYKDLHPNSEGGMMNDMSTYETRQSLNLLYYGYGEPRMVEVPGQNKYVANPRFHQNKFESLEDSGILGQAW